MIDDEFIDDEFDALFSNAALKGMVSAMEIDGPRRLNFHAHDQAYAASTFKIAVGLELFCQAVEGELDLSEAVTLDPADRTLGGQGLCLFAHPAAISLHDLAILMLTISDNTATDAVIRKVGPQRINTRLATLGLVHTDFACTIHEHFNALGLTAATRPAYHEVLGRPDVVPCTTAAEMAQLLALVWRDEAGPTSACADLRAVIANQHLTRKIAAGFPGDVTVAAKSGTVPGVISNDTGVVTYPDGRRYAVAVFTRALAPRPAADDPAHVIGTAARIAVDYLQR